MTEENTLLIDYSEEDQQIGLNLQEGSMTFVFPPEHSKVVLMLLDVLQKVFTDEASVGYMKAMQARIQRGHNELQ